MKISNSKIHYGFTLVELIVAMTIFGLLAAATIANFRQAQKKDALRHDSLALAENIRKVQNLGMSGQVFTGGSQSIVPEGGYGVYYNPSTQDEYLLFADLNNTLNPEEKSLHYYDNTQDQLLNDGVISLSDNVQIYEFKISDVVGCINCEANISFQPPKPYPYACATIDHDCGEKRNVCILVKHETINNCRLIYVNGVSGQVSESSSDCEADLQGLCPSPTI